MCRDVRVSATKEVGVFASQMRKARHPEAGGSGSQEPRAKRLRAGSLLSRWFALLPTVSGPTAHPQEATPVPTTRQENRPHTQERHRAIWRGAESPRSLSVPFCGMGKRSGHTW